MARGVTDRGENSQASSGGVGPQERSTRPTNPFCEVTRQDDAGAAPPAGAKPTGVHSTKKSSPRLIAGGGSEALASSPEGLGGTLGEGAGVGVPLDARESETLRPGVEGSDCASRSVLEIAAWTYKAPANSERMVTAEPIKTMSRKFDQALKAANTLPIFTMQG